MKALILAAGYGTRLTRDIENDQSGLYAHLKGVPKPLLPIGPYSLVTHWMHTLQEIPEIDAVYVMTNGANYGAFKTWSDEWPTVQLACDGTTSNETRIGAVACMQFVVDHFSVEEDLLVIAGDTLFYDDFNLSDLISQFGNFKQTESSASMLTYVTCTDAEVHKYGILETNEHMKVIGFLEKPQPDETVSRKECPCFYFLSRDSLPSLQKFLEERKDGPLKSRDATGNFIAFLHKEQPVYATEISGRFDVGGLQSYITCHEHFLKKHSKN